MSEKKRTYWNTDNDVSRDKLFDFTIGRYRTGRAYAISKLKGMIDEEERRTVVEPQQASLI